MIAGDSTDKIRFCGFQSSQGLISDRLDGFISVMRVKGVCIDLDLVLDAAENVVLVDGVSGLTLEAVAAKAGISKGGLLYHYPSKERLISAMVERIVQQWRADFLEAIASVPEGPGRVARGFLAHCFDESHEWDDCVRRGSVVLLAALSANSSLVEPMRACNAEICKLLRDDGLKPGYAECVLSALDGLWFTRVFGLEQRDRATLENMRRCLEEVVQRGMTGAHGAGELR